MGIIVQTAFGIIVIAVASFVIYVSIKDVDTVGSKLVSLAFGVLFLGIGIWCAWPLALLIADLVGGSEHLARYTQKRETQEAEKIGAEGYLFGSIAVALAFANVPGSIVLSYFLRKDRPGSREWLFMPATVLLVSGVVLAAKVQTWTGAAFPLRGLLVTVNDSISAAGIAAFIVLWASIWMGAIGTRLAAALPMGPVAAFMTPAASFPYYYGYYQQYGWGWMVLLFFASVLLGFFVNAVRDAENERIEEARNKSTESLFHRVFERLESGSVPDYVLFLRPFQGTGTLDTQADEEALDLETILARALRPRWLVGLGSRMERSIVGAGRVYFRDDEWWDSLRLLAKSANGIIIVPSEHEGTLKEIRWLHEERLLSKCVFVMPPRPGQGGWYVNVHGSSTVHIKDYAAPDPAQLWSTARAALRDSPGIELPPYMSEGALLALDAEGRVVKIQPLALGSVLFKVRRLRRALVPVLPAATLSA